MDVRVGALLAAPLHHERASEGLAERAKEFTEVFGAWDWAYLPGLLDEIDST